MSPNYNQYSAIAAQYMALAANIVDNGTGKNNEQGTVASESQAGATNFSKNPSPQYTSRSDSSRTNISMYSDEHFTVGFGGTCDRDIDLHPEQLSTKYPEPPPELIEELNRCRRQVRIANYNPAPKPIVVKNSQRLNPQANTQESNFLGFEVKDNDPKIESEIALLQWEEEERKRDREKLNTDWRKNSEIATLHLMNKVDSLFRAIIGDFSYRSAFT